MFDPINLDDMSVEPADYLKAEEVFAKLARYSHLKCLSMNARLTGRMNDAAKSEAIMERIYQDLPEWARW